MNRKLLVAPLLVALVAGVVHAIDVTVALYKPNQTAQGFREAVAVIDTATLDGASSLLLPYMDVGLNQTVRVDLKMSVASATCKVHFVRSNTLWKAPFSKSSSTGTADARFTVGGKYVADSMAFDTGAYRYCKIFLEAPSSGTVDVDLTVCGSNP